MQFGGALGLAVLSAVATGRTNGSPRLGRAAFPLALTAGFQRAFLVGTVFVLVAALVAFLAATPANRDQASATHTSRPPSPGLVPATGDLSSE